MEDNSINTNVKRKMDKRTRGAFILMAVLLVLSMTTTIVLAAFQANKTSTATLTFANGIKLALTKTGTSNTTIEIADAAASVTGTFTYSAKSGSSMTGLSAAVNMDGIKATLTDQAGFLAYSILVKMGDAGSTTSAVTGSWSAISGSGTTSTFQPQGQDWTLILTVPASTWSASATTNATTPLKVSQSSGTAIATGSTGVVLFSKIVIQGATDASNVTSLAGKQIDLEFVICADTVSAANALAAV